MPALELRLVAPYENALGPYGEAPSAPGELAAALGDSATDIEIGAVCARRHEAPVSARSSVKSSLACPRTCWAELRRVP